MYVFGDSTVDPGNNNFIKTAFRSDFPPYGRDFANQVPTGRFTNGKLGTDFIGNLSFSLHVKYFKIKLRCKNFILILL